MSFGQNLEPPPLGLGKSFRDWLLRFYAKVVSMEDIRTPDTLLRQTPRGVSRSVIPVFGESIQGLKWKGRWNPASSYDPGDIVWLEDDDYGVALLPDAKFFTSCAFVAVAYVPPGLDPPHPVDPIVSEDPDVSSDPNHWDIFPNAETQDLVLNFGGKLVSIAAGPEGGTGGDTWPTIGLYADWQTIGALLCRISIDDLLALSVTGTVQFKLVTFKNGSGSNETRAFLCSDPI